MLKLVLRRLLVLPVILMGVAAMTFALAWLSPFDPVDAYVGYESQASDETKAEIARTWVLTSRSGSAPVSRRAPAG